MAATYTRRSTNGRYGLVLKLPDGRPPGLSDYGGGLAAFPGQTFRLLGRADGCDVYALVPQPGVIAVVGDDLDCAGEGEAWQAAYDAAGAEGRDTPYAVADVAARSYRRGHGVEELCTLDLQSGRWVTLLVCAPGAVIVSYGYKRRHSQTYRVTLAGLQALSPLAAVLGTD